MSVSGPGFLGGKSHAPSYRRRRPLALPMASVLASTPFLVGHLPHLGPRHVHDPASATFRSTRVLLLFSSLAWRCAHPGWTDGPMTWLLLAGFASCRSLC